MFNSIRSKLGLGMADDLEEVQDTEDMDMLDSPEAMPDIDPDTVLSDPESTMEMKKMALQMIRDRYLKPQEE
jgi:hypothetical protein